MVGEDPPLLELYEGAGANRREIDLLAEIPAAQMQATSHEIDASESPSAEIGERGGEIR